MSHNIALINQQHACFSLNQNPWHKLGTVVPEAVPIDEAFRLAQLDWTVTKAPLYSDELEPVPTHRVIVRDIDRAQLGVVGEGYQPLQNHELADFLKQAFDGLPLVVETAGALKDGRIVWALARLTHLDFRIGYDESHSYLLISNAHDGSRTVTVAPTSIRVVCSNTLQMADARIRARRGVDRLATGSKIRHTSGMKRALDDLAKSYRNALDCAAVTQQAMRHLAACPVRSEQHLRRFFATVFDGPDESGRARAIKEHREQQLMELYHGPTCTVRGTASSWFAALNAATEYIDHHRPTRGGDADAQRFASSVFGSGAGVKAQAYTAALAAAG